MWRIMDKKARVLCSLLLGLTVVLYQSANGLRMCNDGESKFHMKNKIQHCSDNNWEDECTITWSTINADTACSRLTESPTTVTKTIIMTDNTELCSSESNNGETEHCTTILTKTTTTVFPSCACTIVPSTTLATTSTQLCELSSPAQQTEVQMSTITITTVTTTITLQPSLTCSKETNTPSPKLSTQSRETSTALGVVIAILLLSLVGVVIGWVLMCIVMRRRETKQGYSAPPAAVRLERYTTDKQRHHQHQHPGHPGQQQPQCHITETNDDYATVIDNIDTERYTTNGNKEQQPRGPQPGVPPQEQQPRVPQRGQQPGVSKQRGRESQQVLVDNDYHVLEEINEEKSELDNDYYLLEQEDEDLEGATAGGVDHDYHVLEGGGMSEHANGEEEDRKKEGEEESGSAAAALYEIPITTKNKSN